MEETDNRASATPSPAAKSLYDLAQDSFAYITTATSPTPKPAERTKTPEQSYVELAKLKTKEAVARAKKCISIILETLPQHWENPETIPKHESTLHVISYYLDLIENYHDVASTQHEPTSPQPTESSQTYETTKQQIVFTLYEELKHVQRENYHLLQTIEEWIHKKKFSDLVFENSKKHQIVTTEKLDPTTHETFHQLVAAEIFNEVHNQIQSIKQYCKVSLRRKSSSAEFVSQQSEEEAVQQPSAYDIGNTSVLNIIKMIEDLLSLLSRARSKFEDYKTSMTNFFKKAIYDITKVNRLLKAEYTKFSSERYKMHMENRISSEKLAKSELLARKLIENNMQYRRQLQRSAPTSTTPKLKRPQSSASNAPSVSASANSITTMHSNVPNTAPQPRNISPPVQSLIEKEDMSSTGPARPSPKNSVRNSRSKLATKGRPLQTTQFLFTPSTTPTNESKPVTKSKQAVISNDVKGWATVSRPSSAPPQAQAQTDLVADTEIFVTEPTAEPHSPEVKKRPSTSMSTRNTRKKHHGTSSLSKNPNSVLSRYLPRATAAEADPVSPSTEYKERAQLFESSPIDVAGDFEQHMKPKVSEFFLRDKP